MSRPRFTMPAKRLGAATLITAVLAVVLLPGVAQAAPRPVLIDCTTPTSVQLVSAAAVTVQQVNCGAITVAQGTVTPAPADGAPAATFSLSPGGQVILEEQQGSQSASSVFVRDAPPVADPAGTLLSTNAVTVPVAADEMTVAEGSLGGVAGCGIQPGAHVYKTLGVSITTAGDFTFRVISTNPESNSLDNRNPYYAISDPFLAVYQDFNPADPGAGVVGCNDDSGDNGVLSDGETVVNGLFSRFSRTLAPGEYTLVLTTYGTASAASWAQTGLDQSATFQLWGPEGALEVIEAPQITGNTLPAELTIGTPATGTLTATGTAPISYAVTAGALPTGLSLDTTTGVISGTPTQVGTYTYSITATNAGGAFTETFTQTVSEPVITAPETPTITSPADGASLTGEEVTFTGTGPAGANIALGVTPDSTLEPAEGILAQADDPADPILVDENGTWEVTLALTPDTYVAQAIAFTGEANPVFSEPSAPVSFTLAAAAVNPVPVPSPSNPVATPSPTAIVPAANAPAALALTGSNWLPIGAAASILALAGISIVLAARNRQRQATN